jgi:hypothetical protein
MPRNALELNGQEWPMACFNGTEVQRFFIIGHLVQNWSEDILIFKSWNISESNDCSRLFMGYSWNFSEY